MKPSEVKPGDRFGNLTVQVIQQHYRNGKKNGFEAICLCDCGNQKIITLSNLVSAHGTSCGCLQKQSCVNNIKYALASLSSHPEIRQGNIKYALATLSSHPEIRQETCRKTGKKTGSENIKYAHSYLQAHPEIMEENGRSNVKYAHAFFSSHLEVLQRNVRHAVDARRRDPNSESSLQKEYRLFLEQNNISYESEFLLENHSLSHYFDFKVNNFLIEIHGDIYHSSAYENLSNPLSKPPPTAFKSPDYHKSLLDLATSHGYRLIQLWEHNSFEFNSSLLRHQLDVSASIDEYVEIIDGHRVICDDYGFNTQGTYLPDPGKWISTNSHEIVPSSYEKGKVLVFNSGYTILGE